MRPTAWAPPTRREVVLVLCLLVFLLLVSQHDHVFFAERVRDIDALNVPGGGLSADAGAGAGVDGGAGEVAVRDPRLTWTGAVPETTLVAHVPGWTMFDRLYAKDGTLYIVTSKPHLFPEPRWMTSSGYRIENGEEEERKRLPTDKDMRIISPEEALTLFGTSATRLDGANWLNTDPPQFITHYYHWTAELLFGLWRAYSSLDPYITPDGRTTLPPPRRFLFTHVECTQWRDYASMNQWVLRGAFPALAMEFSDDWRDRARMAHPVVFDRVLLADRAAAFHGPNFGKTWRTASEAFALRGSPNWWAPVRNNVLEFSGLAPEWVLGPDPGDAAARQKFVITYISRQDWGRRMLIAEDHERLVRELTRLKNRYGYELNIVSMDKLSRREQFQLAGRTTIMMGVHGNGLTSLVWMRPTPRATVIEFFYPEGLAFDYEYTTRALGMVHYGVWNNVTFTRPDVPPYPNYPEGFQGNEIPLDGVVVANLVHRRLQLDQETDD